MRNITCEAVVLRTRRQGDYDKQLTLFSPQLGLIRATVYGAFRGRSRLSGSTEQFIRLKAYLYYNPVRQSWKLSDAEVLAEHRGILQSIDRVMAASAGAEIIMKTDAAGGEGAGLYTAYLDFLQSAETFREEDLIYPLIQFLWRYIDLAGYQADLSACPECGKALGGDIDTVYSPDQPGFVCARCAGPSSRVLPEGGRRYLLHTLSLPWDKAARVRVDRSTAGRCRDILADYVAEVVESPIHSLQRGDEPV